MLYSLLRSNRETGRAGRNVRDPARVAVKKIDSYLVKETVPLILLSLLVLILALLMNQFLVLADVFIARGVRVGKALELLGLLVPSAAAFSFPLAFLAGVVVAVSRLAVDSEITALRALGVPAGRLLRPLFALAGVAVLLTFYLSAFAAPRANAAWVKSMSEALFGDVRPRIEPAEFSRAIPGAVFFYRARGEGGAWNDVFAALERDSSEARIILAREAWPVFDRTAGRLVVSFADGAVHRGRSDEAGTYSVTNFSRLEETMDLSAVLPAGAPAKGVREKDLGELLAVRRAFVGRPAGEPELLLVEVEIHKKFSLSVLCLVFAFFGLRLGLLAGRHGRPAGFSLSLILIFIVYFLYITAEKLAAAGNIRPVWAMWLPPLILGAAGLLLVRTEGQARPGRTPTGCFRSFIGRRALFLKRFGLMPFTVLDRYVFRKAFMVFVLAAPGCLLVACLGTAFEKMADFIRHEKAASRLLEYVVFKIPELFVLTLPLAVLIASMVSVGLLARSNEITAMKACGISVVRIVGPVIVLGLLVAGLSFLVKDGLVPSSEARARQVLNRATGRPPEFFDQTGRGFYFDALSRRIYRYEYFDPEERKLGRFSVFDLEAGRWALAARTQAPVAVLKENGRFDLAGGFRIEFGPAGPSGAVSRQVASLEGRGAETGFFGPAAVPSQMKFGKLKEFAGRIRRLGFDPSRIEVELASRISFAFACLIMAFIGLPAGLSVGRKGFAALAGAAVAVAAVYWGMFAFLRSLGYGGLLPPALAAWGANAIFGLAGLVMVLRIKS